MLWEQHTIVILIFMIIAQFYGDPANEFILDIICI